MKPPLRTSLKGIVLFVLMLASAAAAVALKPGHRLSAANRSTDYELLIPQAFLTWSTVQMTGGIIVDPRVQDTLDRLYSQVVTRTYRDSISGQIVMLSIAYDRSFT